MTMGGSFLALAVEIVHSREVQPRPAKPLYNVLSQLLLSKAVDAVVDRIGVSCLAEKSHIPIEEDEIVVFSILAR